MNVIFRAQHGDVGPWDVREEDVSYQAWQEHVFERWPNSGCQGTPAERQGEHDGGACHSRTERVSVVVVVVMVVVVWKLLSPQFSPPPLFLSHHVSLGEFTYRMRTCR